MKQKLIYNDLYCNGAWIDDSNDIIADIVSIWDSGHQIIICHPNQVFLNKPVTAENKDFSSVDWLELVSAASYKDDDIYICSCSDYIKSWNYIEKRLQYELSDNEKGQSPRHLVIVEQDGNGGRLVRCILKADKNSIKVAENPLYTKYKPKSVFEQETRSLANKNISLSQYINSILCNDEISNKPKEQDSLPYKEELQKCPQKDDIELLM
ncbi:MAG: hypothetical protein E7376_05455 [Clostridiales bacterium]|nr:hypothetical protein [Clostridiales bacterium]